MTKTNGKGVTLRRAEKFFQANFNAEWVYNLDGGQSFALLCRKREKNKMTTLAGGYAKVADVMAFTE